ncbi:MAG: DoxX family membrane protein [Cyanobacteria bacterium]|nr:DoxX family membrane protein [Cyanobacteriota bacterium]
MSFFRWSNPLYKKNQGRKFQDPNRHVKRAVVFFRVMLGVFLLISAYQQLVTPQPHVHWLSAFQDQEHTPKDLQVIAVSFRWILLEYPVIFSHCWLAGTCLVGLSYVLGWKVRTASLLLTLASLSLSLLGLIQVDPGGSGLWNNGLLLFLSATCLQWSHAGMIGGLDAWEANRWRWPQKMRKRRLNHINDSLNKTARSQPKMDFEHEHDDDLDEDLDQDDLDFSRKDSPRSRKQVKTLAAHRHSRLNWQDDDLDNDD